MSFDPKNKGQSAAATSFRGAGGCFWEAESLQGGLLVWSGDG